MAVGARPALQQGHWRQQRDVMADKAFDAHKIVVAEILDPRQGHFFDRKQNISLTVRA